MATKREDFENDLDFDPNFDDMEVDVDDLLAAIHEDQLYEPPRRARRDRSARQRIESRRERRLLRKQLSDWDWGEDFDDDRN